jgi:hypothetical protein
LQRYAKHITDTNLTTAQKLDAVKALRDLLFCLWGPETEIQKPPSKN